MAASKTSRLPVFMHTPEFRNGIPRLRAFMEATFLIYFMKLTVGKGVRSYYFLYYSAP
jgi:hypothetical protein